jgi:hypothetical protein
LQGKPVAVFGCGDAVRFKSNFADTLAEVGRFVMAGVGQRGGGVLCGG